VFHAGSTVADLVSSLRDDASSFRQNAAPILTGPFDNVARSIVITDTGSSQTGYNNNVAGTPDAYSRTATTLDNVAIMARTGADGNANNLAGDVIAWGGVGRVITSTERGKLQTYAAALITASGL
jgi:hypothetical protein